MNDAALPVGSDRKAGAVEVHGDFLDKIHRSDPSSIGVTAIIDSINAINDARNMRDMLDAMARGFAELGAGTVCYAIADDSRISISGIYPREMLMDLNGIFGLSIETLSFSATKNPDNPFHRAGQEGRALLFHGRERLNEFMSLCFPRSDAASRDRALKRFEGQSMLVLPLSAEGTVMGSVAVAADVSVLESRYDSFVLLACVTADFLARQRDAEESNRTLEKYRLLVENSRDMIFLCAFDGTIRFSNHSYSGSRNIFDFFTGLNATLLKKAFVEVIEMGDMPAPLEIPLQGPGGASLWSEITVKHFRDIEGSLEVTARDITERKVMEGRMASLQAVQNEIFHNEFIGIVTMDLAGAITSWNNGAEKITGLAEGDIIGSRIYNMLDERDRPPFRASVKGAVHSSRQISGSAGLHGTGGKRVPVMYILSALGDRSTDGSLMLVFFDISERVRLEEHSRELITQLNEAQLMTILTLTKLTEYRDIETGSHLERIMKYTELIARELSNFDEFRGYISENYINDLVTSSPLHDIGKVGIPDQILHKPGRFTDDEFDVMKRHTIIGGNSIIEAEKRVKGRSFLNLGKEVAFYHHERWDGKGYPKGLKGEDIPLSARIVALADVYDALTTKRPYKAAFSHAESTGIINESAGSHFDALIVKAFINRNDEFNYWREYYQDR